MRKFIFITGLLMSIFFYSCKEEDHGILPPIEGGGTVEVKDGRVTINPAEYLHAIRNPMKGLREFFGPGYDKVRDEYPYPYGSIIKEYMQWNMLEDNESDGVDKIIAYSKPQVARSRGYQCQGYPAYLYRMDGTLARRICQEHSYRQP